MVRMIALNRRSTKNMAIIEWTIYCSFRVIATNASVADQN